MDQNLVKNSINSTHKKKTRASITFYYIIAFSSIILAIGCVWAILDAIQPTGKWEWFLSISYGLKFIIIGAFGFFFFILLTIAWILFRRGNRFIYKLLYPNIERPKIKKENTAAKIITAGLLISVFIITAGLVISILQGIFSRGESYDLIIFITSLPNGLLIMLISLIVLSITILIVIFVWIWENGYNFVLNKIIKYNEPIEKESFSNSQKSITITVYIITFASLILLSFGLIWAISDAIQPTGKWEQFISLPFIVKVTIIAGLASLLFILLIFALLFSRRGRIVIGKIIYKRLEYKHGVPTKGDKILTIGLITFLNVIILGVVIWLINYIVSLSGGGTITIMDFIKNLPNGLLIIFTSGLVLCIIWGIIYGVRFSKLYYHGFMKSIIKMRSKITKFSDVRDENTNSEKE